MKVGTVTCWGGEYNDNYEYLSSIHLTFEGAKKEAIRLAEVENDKIAEECRIESEKYKNINGEEWEFLFFTVEAPSDETSTFFKLTKHDYSGLTKDYIEVGLEEVLE